MKSKCKTSLLLAKDQWWKVNECYIHIVDLGKSLVHYKMSTVRQQRGIPVKMTRINTVLRYLKSNRAVLEND